MDYSILADVSMDIDREFMKNNEIDFVPMTYMLGEESHRCEEPESDEMMHEYYDKLRNKVATRTSQITPFHYVEVFKTYVEAHRPLIYLALSSGLSTTYESALMAVTMLKEDYDDVRIEVVDSLGATGGMGLLAESACENRKRGMNIKENADWLREYAGKVNYWFKVEDLMYLMRGGRVSAATAVVGTALGIKPILTIRPDGKLDTVAKKRGNRQAMHYIVEQIERNFDPSVSNSVYICCADCKKDAEQLKEEVLRKYPKLNIHITMLSPIIGAHTGPDMLSLIYYGTDRV
ncbi:MAG: DegV family protein [Lachnospiraceae bacterium]|nr:DegV family protein [Lachnospiraceae bacterium]